ncbi:uncharacterized protein A4U43_C01F7450 [Asparagus officinalis]|uniref:Uncharacterized protein n=1 Tax=Asparagus officinalis TaxID=4686 RepID=A0A5P1FP98_ASPOF|nr:uncharacterized protein A4U43_C01F7450 [Asparagus officinalis]
MDGGKKAFCLEKESGAKCYTLCARDLGIAWGDDERYWRWVFHPRSRFSEVVELRLVWLFDTRTNESWIPRLRTRCVLES